MDFKKFIPHVSAALILFAVAALFFAPNFFSGRALPQSDNEKARAIQTEIQDYIKKEGRAPLWTNSLFGGMPSFQIYTTPKGNLTQPLAKAAFLFGDSSDLWASMFAAMLFMYILLVVLKCDWKVGVFGALAFGVTSYNVDLLEAGHSTKMAALALAPAVMAGIVLLFNKRWVAGAGMLALFTSLEIYVNHIQITYYIMMTMGIYVLGMLVKAIREKDLQNWAKAAALSAAAIGLGVLCNMSKIWPTYEYAKETIRGGSELTSKSEKGDGLDKDYLFGWSCGVCESGTLLVPHAAGGGAGESYRNTSIFKKVITNLPANVTADQLARQLGGLLYTGEQPFVGTAIYFGVVAMFMFFLGAFLVDGPTKWWFLIGGLLMVSFAWGKHFFLNSDVWYNYLPLFNKFRAVTMAFGPAQLCVAALAALGLQRLCDPEVTTKRKKMAAMLAFGITAALCLLAVFCAPDSGPNESVLGDNQELLSLLKKDREAMIYGDLYRSLGFLAVAGALVWLYLRGIASATLAVLAVSAVALTDHWLVCRRTLDDSKYESKRAAVAPPAETTVDKNIKSDPDPYYRVLDLRGGDIATNYMPSFYHKNIGGYHAAKLQIFQELLDVYFTQENFPKSIPILGMMNVKYAITQTGFNRVADACGNAWFVNHFEVVPDADAELAALGSLHPRDSAVFQQKYASMLDGFTVQPDSTATIRLTAYHPEKLEYEYSAKTEQLAMFSEIYYPPSKGWKVYLNGQPAPDFTKANYVLRAMRLPAGQKQKLEMRFEPQSFYTGEKISFAASALTLILCIIAFYFWYKNGAPLTGGTKLASVASEPKPSKSEAQATHKKKK
ncbi:MAG: hypothetical protein JNJ57_14000 [Saprospiraceae bacterium]|nr:hypothetical protein [Saprospiraceae bacterium]